MTDREDPKNKIIRLVKQAAPTEPAQPKPARKRSPRPENSIEVNGHGNIVGNGNTVIKTEKLTHKTIAEPKPGAEHITEEQVRRLHDLKDQIIQLEQAAKRNPATHQRVWSTLNKTMRVGSMRMIPKDKFNAAEKYMLGWIGQLMDRPAAQKNAPDTVRKRRITYIQTNMKKLGVEDKVRAYMLKNYAVTSLTDLHDQAALEAVYRYVSGLKQRANNRAKNDQ